MVRSLFAGLLASIAFLALFFLLQVSVLWSPVVAIVVYIALSLLFSKTVNPADLLPEVEGMSRVEAYEEIMLGRGKVDKMREDAKSVDNDRIQGKVEDICAVADQIFDEFERDPKDIPKARQFLDYYLDATTMVVQRYTELSNRSSRSADTQRVLNSFESLLETVRETFQKQYEKLLRDDVLDLDTEITVLQQMMDMEGL